MATRQEEELKNMRGASAIAYTPFSQARGAEAIRGFGSGMAPRISEPASIFGASAQQSSQDFSRLQMPPSPSIPLGNTIPVFPDNYNQVMGEKTSAPSPLMANIKDQRVLGDISGFSPYSPTVPSMGGLNQTPSMAPVTNAISSFASPLASQTERIDSQYGTASTTLTPEQQVMRAQTRQQAEQAGTIPRTPEQQQALLAQMREKGAALGQQRVANMEEFFKQKRAERSELTKATSQPQGGFMASGVMPSFDSSPLTASESTSMSDFLDFNRPSPSSSPTALTMWRKQFDPFFRSQERRLQRNLDRINS
jgi:hypothetical protein